MNKKYLVKTINSIDIGISPSKIIDKKKLLLNLKYIFPDKNYAEIKKKINRGKFFYFEKKISEENYEKLMQLGDKSIEPRDNLIRIYPQKSESLNLAFDITPAKLITGLITERGICEASEKGLKGLFK